ncbi:MAG: DNA primase [Cyanobacteria bacterium P01_H01_bin.74]
MAVPFTEAADTIKSRLDIVELVQRYVVLKKSGRSWRGLCPFHADKKPSMDVNREKGVFICRSCGAGGGTLNFLMQIENKTYREIILDLAEEQGIEIEVQGPNAAVSSKIREDKKACLTLQETALDWFTKQLTATAGSDNTAVLAYLKKRYPDAAFYQAAISQFQLGVAPPGWSKLYEALKQTVKSLDASPNLLEVAGLCVAKSHGTGYYDRFRNRLMIPIFNERGQAIAFGGRSLSADDMPKYLNSPETPIYKKSQVLYGAFQAKSAIKETGTAIVMEGYFDVISAHVAGIANAVGSCGTALTQAHLKLLTRLGASTIVLAFDSDRAGIAAALSAIGLIDPYLKQNHLQLTILLLPDGKDPDEFIMSQGADAFGQLLKNHTLPYREFQLNQAIAGQDVTTPEGRIAAADQLTPILASIAQPMVRSEYTRLFADRIQISEEALALEIKRHARTQQQSEHRQRAFEARKQPGKHSAATLTGKETGLLTLKKSPLAAASGEYNGQQPSVPGQKSWRMKQVSVEENILKVLLYSTETYQFVLQYNCEIEEDLLALYGTAHYKQILSDIIEDWQQLNTKDALRNASPLLEVTLQTLSIQYAETPEQLKILAELATQAESFGESLSFNVLSGPVLQEKVNLFLKGQIQLLKQVNHWLSLEAIYSQKSENETETLAQAYSLQEKYNDPLTESPHQWGFNLDAHQPLA